MDSSKIEISRLGLRLLGITLFTQAGIVVTGALVRLTGSGLGCPTWPRCTQDSFVPEPSQVEGLHKWIEFGNRLLTFVVALAAIASFVYVVVHHLRKAKLPAKFLFLTSVPFLGTIAQAILGGITVLTELNPFTVAAHFLLSVFIVAIAARNRVYAEFAPVSNATTTVKLLLSRMLLLAGLVIVVLGVITTGSGPHAGDEIAQRFDLDVSVMAWLHADAVWFFTGLLIANYAINRSSYLLKISGAVLIQIVVGYVQWFNGLPWLLVGIHVALAILIWNWLVKFQLMIKLGVR
ncbi:MAG: COX15/CtaA family protein [Candidatus Nanopelagicales bacterium]